MANQVCLKKDSKKIIMFFLFLVLTAVWMMVIFGFSANDAEESTIQSNAVTEFVLRIFNSDFEKLSPEEQQSLVDSYDRITRKLAHFTAYAILGFFWYHTLFFFPGNFFCKKYKLYAFSFVPCVIFAATDEYHQTLVEGRAGRMTDVLIDSSGVAFGIIMAVVLAAVVRKIQHNKIK